jgi:tetratricopeptide (TPR) repeat protein
MRWLVGARNYIEKAGDLKTLSVADATVTVDWGMRIYQRFPVDPFLSTSQIAERVREAVPVAKEEADSALLAVERRWVDVQLPDYEVLDALSYCYSFIAKLVEDAHAHVGIRGLCAYRKAMGVIDIDQKRIEHLGGRPPCMVATRAKRTVWVKLSTGEELRPMQYHKEFELEELQEAAERYGLDKNKELLKKKPRNLREEAEYWFAIGKAILARDGYHSPMILLHGPNPETINMRIDDQVDKYLMWEKIAEHVEVSGAQSLIFIGEAWIRVPEEKLRSKDYSYKPREGLSLIAASNDGEFVSICAEFKREGNSIHFLKEHLSQKESSIESRQLEPVRRVWIGKAEERSTQFELPRIRFAKVPWIEDEKTACPCGSGASFADCCKAYVPSGRQLLKEVESADISEREKVYRGALTHYIGNVVRYTIPALGKFPEKVSQLVEVDIKALCELSETIALYLDSQGRTKEAIRLFRHIREIVKLPGLEKRMIYMEAVWYDAKLGDRVRARAILGVIDIEREDDIEIIQFYLDVFELAPEKKLKLIERILEGTNLPSVTLHYSTFKSTCLHMEGRNEEAMEVIRDAIDQYAIGPEHIPDHYYMNVCGRAYGMKWRLMKDEDDFRKAIQYYKTLKYKEFTPCGKAGLYREIAELYSAHGDYTKAVKYYRLSLKAEKSEAGVIHLGECYIRRGSLKKARKILGRISFEGLAEVYRLEFLSVQALLAIKTSDKELGQDTIRKLSLLGTCHKYFERQREEILEELRERFTSSVPRDADVKK